MHKFKSYIICTLSVKCHYSYLTSKNPSVVNLAMHNISIKTVKKCTNPATLMAFFQVYYAVADYHYMAQPYMNFLPAESLSTKSPAANSVKA